MRFLRESDIELQVMCLTAMKIIYEKHFKDYGIFHETEHIITLIENTYNIQIRDSLVVLLSALVLHPLNVDILLKHKTGPKTLLELLSMVHTQPPETFHSSLLQQAIAQNTLMLTNSANVDDPVAAPKSNEEGKEKPQKKKEKEEEVVFREWMYK